MTVSFKSRMLDVASISLVVIGAACWVWAYLQLEALRQSTHDPKATIFAGYVRFVRLVQLSRLGVGLIAVGVVVGVTAALHNRRARRQSA